MKNKGKFSFAFLMSVVLTACFVFAACSNDEDDDFCKSGIFQKSAIENNSSISKDVVPLFVKESELDNVITYLKNPNVRIINYTYNNITFPKTKIDCRNLEMLSPSEESQIRLPDVDVNLIITSISYQHIGDNKATFVSDIQIIGPSCYSYRSWEQYNTCTATWLNDSIVSCNVKGCLHAIAHINGYKIPTSKEITETVNININH